MEATQKQKGFIKSKLPKSFARATKRTSQPQCSIKVTPGPPLAIQNGFNQSSLQRVSYVNDTGGKGYVDTGGKGYVNTTWGSYGCDENVDMKAADYISYVRGQFNKERVDSSGARHQEMLQI